MHTHLISYDLIRPHKDYGSLIAFIKTYDNSIKPLESVWLVKNNLTSIQTRDQIRKYVDTNDKVFVVDVTSDSAAWHNLGQEVSSWITSNL